MTIVEYIQSVRDPMGLPFYPLVFQILMVLTFALHIIFVNLVIGGVTLALWGEIKGGPYPKRLSRTMARAATVNLSLAIVLAVAPLLFVQTLYDPFWYTANIMSARWVWTFLIAVIVAFYSIYAFYLRGAERGKNPLWLILALAALTTAAVIIHALTIEQLKPEFWREWMVRERWVNTQGDLLKAFDLPRLLHFVFSSWAVTGIFLMFYARYFQRRPDYDSNYLKWVATLGSKQALFFSAISAGTGIAWLMEEPAALLSNPIFWTALFLAMALLAILISAQSDPLRYVYPVGVVGLLTVFFMAFSREALREYHLAKVGYSVFDYRLNIDWGSTTLFLATFILGLVILAYPILVAYKAGQRKNPHRPADLRGLEPLGRLATILPVVWLGAVVLLGLYISIRNGTLF